MSVEREKITVHSLESRPAFQEGFSSVEVFKRMVKAFTGVNLQIKEVETEKEFHKPVGNVKVKFDLFAEDEKNRTIVEAQHANYSQNFERFYYYHLIAITETIKSSQDYHFPKTVYTLVGKIFSSQTSVVLYFYQGSRCGHRYARRTPRMDTGHSRNLERVGVFTQIPHPGNKNAL